MMLIYKVQANWRTRKRKSNWVTSVIILDVKNTFGHVGTAQFVTVCMKLGLLTELIY
jgi:hypothetical protein